MSHTAHLRNQFQSINPYNYTITLIKREKRHYLLFENCLVLVCLKLNPLHLKCFVLSLVEIGSAILEKTVFKFCYSIFVVSLLSPLGEGQDPSSFEIKLPLTDECFVPSLVEIGQVVLEKTMKM